MLAGLAHAPSRDNPLRLARARPRRARARALRRMRRARLRDRGGRRARPRRAARRAPRDAAVPRAALHDARPRVARDRRASRRRRRPSARRSTLELQAELEAEVRHTVDVLRDRGVQHAAAVVLDNATGEVLAWVGSPDFWADDDGQTDMVVSPRQPGSALKPFLYGLAFDRGFTRGDGASRRPEVVRDADRPVRAAQLRPPLPRPGARAGGARQLVQRARRGARVARWAPAACCRRCASPASPRSPATRSYYGLGLALGNGDVTLLELANAYRALANGGVWRPWTWRSRGAARVARRARVAPRRLAACRARSCSTS